MKERDTSKLKPGNHTVRKIMQYGNRTTEKQYKIPNRINNSRYTKMTNIIDTIEKSIAIEYVIS